MKHTQQLESGNVPPVRIRRRPFGILPDTTPVDLYTLTNANGVTVSLITYGGIIVSLETPDRQGQTDDIVLGCETLDSYRQHSPYFGAIIGRYANRIARGQFSLDGKTYHLTTNEGAHHLHGGKCGFDKVVWQATPHVHEHSSSVLLTHESIHNDEGYPGTVHVSVRYTLTHDNRLCVEYDAITDQATPINLTQHTYFNLTGGRRDVLDHLLQIDADMYTPIDQTLIPTGELRAVAGTPFDFRKPMAIGTYIHDNDVQIRYAGGYDHNFVLASQGSSARPLSSPTHVISVSDPESGRTLDVYTTEPGVQFYSGNFLDGTLRGKHDRLYERHFGFCLETQHFPDSPNHPNFPTTILHPGQQYSSRTEYQFGISPAVVTHI